MSKQLQQNGIGNDETGKLPVNTITVKFESRWEEGNVTTPAKLDLETGIVFDIEASSDGDHYESLIGEYVLIGDREVGVELEPDDNYRLDAVILAAVRAEIGGRKVVEKRIIATFQPQAWIDDNAVDIDGREDVDVTEAVLRLDLRLIHALQDHRDSTDNLMDGTPAAVEHDGPFAVQATASVCEYFGVDVLREITQEQLDRARAQVAVGNRKLEPATHSLMDDALWIMNFLRGIEEQGRHAPTETMQRLIDAIGGMQVTPRDEVAVRPALDGGEVEVFDSGVRSPEIDAAIVEKVFAAAEAPTKHSDDTPSPHI